MHVWLLTKECMQKKKESYFSIDNLMFILSNKICMWLCKYEWILFINEKNAKFFAVELCIKELCKAVFIIKKKQVLRMSKSIFILLDRIES